jgi:hypothetical protein
VHFGEVAEEFRRRVEEVFKARPEVGDGWLNEENRHHS